MMFLRPYDKSLLTLLGMLALSITGCGNAAKEQAAFRKIKQQGGKIELHSHGPEITFSSLPITDDDLICLEELPHVHLVILEFVDITDRGLDHLLRIGQLDGLSIRRTKITDEGIEKLKKKFPDLNVRVY